MKRVYNSHKIAVDIVHDGNCIRNIMGKKSSNWLKITGPHTIKHPQVFGILGPLVWQRVGGHEYPQSN
jgi:hypothetical protein